MRFPENIIPTEITHVTLARFKSHEKTRMENRPWYGIAFPLSGELSYICDYAETKLSENKVVFLPKNSTYDVVCRKAGIFAVINFHTAVDLSEKEFIVTETKNINVFRNEFLFMQEVFMSEAPDKVYSNLSSLYKLFSLLEKEKLKNDIPYPLIKAVDYIEKNFDSSELCNSEIAEHSRISEVYLRKLFSKHLSVSVNQYIRNIRIEKAKTLLLNTDLSITEISEKCGYSCIYYFCNVFRKLTKYTPTQYRDNNFNNPF